MARALWRRLEAIHAVTYFSPEPVSALAAAGYRGYWMGYFAQRAAPLGAVGPELVSATFYNFSPWRVAKAVPDAWTYAPPEVALEARAAGSTAALRRAFDGADIESELATAAELAGRAARSAPLDGRPLFAANAALRWPEDPLGTLWHAATLLREHRGDGHVATLIAAGVAGREAHVLQVASGATTRDVMTVARDYDDVEWRQGHRGARRARSAHSRREADGGRSSAQGRRRGAHGPDRPRRLCHARRRRARAVPRRTHAAGAGGRRHRRSAERHADGTESRREAVETGFSGGFTVKNGVDRDSKPSFPQVGGAQGGGVRRRGRHAGRGRRRTSGRRAGGRWVVRRR